MTAERRGGAGDVMRVGTRVRIKSPCVWPERAGCEGTIVAPPSDGTYPQPAKWEVLVKFDDDPVEHGRPVLQPRWWSCVMDAKDCEAIPLVLDPVSILGECDGCGAVGRDPHHEECPF